MPLSKRKPGEPITMNADTARWIVSQQVKAGTTYDVARALRDLATQSRSAAHRAHVTRYVIDAQTEAAATAYTARLFYGRNVEWSSYTLELCKTC